MVIPPQGLRHAVDLLLTNGARKIPPDAPTARVSAAILHLAEELAALSSDMRASAGCAEWIVAEYERVLTQRVEPAAFALAKDRARAILAAVGRGPTRVDTRDVFIVYVPEDRLPVAAPLAIELSKRRIAVAFSEYEVSTADELKAALDRGMAAHRAGITVVTGNFERRMAADISAFVLQDARLLVLREADRKGSSSLTSDVMHWLSNVPQKSKM